MVAVGTPAEHAPESPSHLWRTALARLRPVSRRAWHPLTALAFLGVIYIVLGGLHVTAGRQLQESSERIASARLALSRPAPQVSQMTLALHGWEFVLVAARSSRVAPLADTELVRRTLHLADSAGVTVIDAGTRSEFVEDINGRQYRAVPYLVKAGGSLPEIEAFLDGIESSLIDTLEIEGALVTGDGNEYTLSLSSVVYSHLPETDSIDDDEAAGQSASAGVSVTTGAGRP